MAYVTVPKDLTKIKSKVMFNLTKRQLICFSAAVAIGLPLFFLVKDKMCIRDRPCSHHLQVGAGRRCQRQGCPETGHTRLFMQGGRELMKNEIEAMITEDVYKRQQEATVNAEKFMNVVRRHTSFEELTPTLLREFVEKIVVHECSYDAVSYTHLRRSVPCGTCRRPCPLAGADTGRNFPLLFPAPAAASDRRTYWPDTQHSGATYPACLAAATAAHGGKRL